MSHVQEVEPTPPAAGHLHADGAGSRSAEDAALLESMGGRLQYSWDRYVTFIHEILLLTGGTILVLLNGMFGKDAQPDVEWRIVGVAALTVAVLGMVAGMAWRLTSQYFMDREVFGSRRDVERYFELCEIKSVSDYASLYYGRTEAVWRWIFRLSQVVAIGFLLLAWVLGGVFVMHNAG